MLSQQWIHQQLVNQQQGNPYSGNELLTDGQKIRYLQERVAKLEAAVKEVTAKHNLLVDQLNKAFGR